MRFISQGYFKSTNCLREARFTQNKQKPLALVFDPVRGGASLESIKQEECPEEMRAAIFDGRTIIEWHRGLEQLPLQGTPICPCAGQSITLLQPPRPSLISASLLYSQREPLDATAWKLALALLTLDPANYCNLGGTAFMTFSS